MKKTFVILSALGLIGLLVLNSLVFAQTSAQKSEQKIQKGKKVSIEYRLRLSDGSVVDNNVGKAPLTYIQGTKQIIPGLERQLEDLKAGDARKIEVSPKEAYGEYIKAAMQEIPKTAINSADLREGAKLYSQDKSGRMVVAEIKEIKKDSVIIDMNHPLAGKTLYFDVKILSVEDATPSAKPQ